MYMYCVQRGQEATTKGMCERVHDVCVSVVYASEKLKLTERGPEERRALDLRAGSLGDNQAHAPRRRVPVAPRRDGQPQRLHTKEHTITGESVSTRMLRASQPTHPHLPTHPHAHTSTHLRLVLTNGEGHQVRHVHRVLRHRVPPLVPCQSDKHSSTVSRLLAPRRGHSRTAPDALRLMRARAQHQTCLLSTHRRRTSTSRCARCARGPK
jgi:hypothetical protein